MNRLHDLLVLLALLLAVNAGAAADERVISVQHDSHRGVTCWVLNDAALSCLPDSQLQNRASPVVDESQSCGTPARERRQSRINPASTPTPRRIQEAMQL